MLDRRFRVHWIGALCIGLLPVCTSQQSLADTAPASASPADTQVLVELLASVKTGDSAAQTALVAKIADPKLRATAQNLLPELQLAKTNLARIAQLTADLEQIKGGKVTIEPGGPVWLRSIVGNEPMKVFDRLTGISINDGRSPHDKDYKLNTSVDDAWLARLADLPDLRRLDLSNAVVQGPGLKHVGTLKTLESLSLTSTPVTDAGLAHLAGLTQLRILSLASSQCTGTGCEYLTALTKLYNLNCHNTPVNDAGLAQIARLTSLERLEIVHCHFTDAGAAHLAKLANLQRLQIGSRQATAAALVHLRELKQLKELDLHDMTPTPAGYAAVGDIASLEVIRSYWGPVDDAAVGQLARLSNLSTLLLHNCQATDAGIEPLATLKKLERLEMPGSKISDAAVAKLKAALPALNVVK